MEIQLIDDCMKLGFGMMRLPRIEGTKNIDLEQTKQMVDTFMEAGGKYFDTAFIYEGSEAATKAALCDRYPRESYYLADKLNASVSKSEEEAKNQIHISLERTGAGYFDFYLLHVDDERVPVGEIVDAMYEMKKTGKIRYYGASNWRVQRLTAADKAAQERGFEGFRANQLTTHPAVGLTNPMPDDTMSMWNRNYADYHRATGMTVMGSSSLAEGFFSDPDAERFAGTMYDSGAARLLAKKILGLSRETGLTPAQICIRFQTDYPGISMIPVFSASTEKNLRELCASFDKPFPQDALFRF